MMQSYEVELVLPDGETARLEVSADESVWDAATRAGITLPSMCLQGWCTTCAGRVLEGEFDPSEALRYYPQDQRAGFILLCTARPRSRMRIVTHQKEEMRAHRHRQGLPTPRG
ncbi:MAG: 2Fe-2S iron-sulfur cluster-binding protein [Geminicoccaceae bacterium]